MACCGAAGEPEVHCQCPNEPQFAFGELPGSGGCPELPGARVPVLLPSAMALWAPPGGHVAFGNPAAAGAGGDKAKPSKKLITKRGTFANQAQVTFLKPLDCS